MGLIGENCTSCQEAAEDPDGGGLAGSWWRAWARVSWPSQSRFCIEHDMQCVALTSQANDQSGYIGAAIVGVFAAILLGYHVGKWGLKKWGEKKNGPVALEVTA